MAIRYGYFDSEITGVDENGMPVFDRAETSDLFRLLFSKLVSSGVLASPADCFQVLADTGLTVRIRPGFAMINGAFAYDSTESTITLAAADANFPRLDRVVLRCNYLNRLCEIITKTGTPASTPTAPELLQPTSGDYYELGLATIRVEAAATSVTQSSIVDTRADSSACGYITQLIDHLDTSEFMSQLTAWQEEYAESQQTAFSNWFDQIKDQLSDDAAGNLQLQIDAHTRAINSQGDTINTINGNVEELDEKIDAQETALTALMRDYIVRKAFNTGGHSCASGTGTINYDYTIPDADIPEGYKPFEVRLATNGGSNNWYEFYKCACDFVPNTNNKVVNLKFQKRSGTGGTLYPWIAVTFVKNI